MFKTLKPYVSMLFWFALGMTVSILFIKSLILSSDTNDEASQTVDSALSQAPNVTPTMQQKKQALEDS